MKKIFPLFIFTLFSLSVFSQPNYFVVTGKVLLANSKQPLQGASVFAQNTTIGTATDSEGNFKLYLPDGGYSIAVTFTGYNTESHRVSNSDPEKNIVFELNEKEKQMEEVSIVSTGEVKDGWTKYGSFFTGKFIGQTANSAACVFKNPEVLKFFFSKKKNRLKVLANEPLLIENNALGYNIRYVLDSFAYEYNTETSIYTGSPLFEEKTSNDSIQQLKWNLARQHAYKGSILHFMRSLYDQKLKEEGFEIQFIVTNNDKDTAIPLKNFYAAMNYNRDDSTQVVEVKPNQQRVGVIFSKEKPAELYRSLFPDEPSEFQFSVLGFLPGGSIGIEQNGYYFDQEDITINAYWTWDKVADLLPYNYGRDMQSQKPVPVPDPLTVPVQPVTATPVQ